MTTSTNYRPSYRLLKHGDEVRSAIGRLKNQNIIGLDIETTGLDPINDRILLIQVGTAEEVFVCDVQALGKQAFHLIHLISNPGIVKLGQNLSFEWAFLEAFGMPLRGRLLDTMIAGKLLNLGLKVPNSLDALVRRHLGIAMEDKKELQKSFIGHEGPFSDEQLAYAAMDVSICFPLWEKLKKLLRKEELSHIFRLECRALAAFASMKTNGFLLNVDYYKQLLVDKQCERDTAKKILLEQFVEAGVLDKYKNPATGCVMVDPESYGKGKNKRKGFNVGSTMQLQPVLRAMGVPIENSLDKNVLAWLSPDHSIIRDYMGFKELNTACSQVEKLIGHAEKHTDHRIRANYRQLGTDTGRASCAGPNLQQVKRDAEYRRGFIAAPGCVLVIADYSQLELRIAAECSGEEKMTQAYLEGADLHTRTASLMLGVAEEDVQKPDRTSSKIINFGALFGSGAKSIRQQAATQYKVIFTLEEAEKKLGMWREAYPQLIGWQQDQGNSIGPVYTLMGRRRLLTPGPGGSDKYTTRLNTQVQGTGGDCMKAALALLWEQYLSIKPSWKLVANVHDEAVLEVPEDDADEAQVVLKECMESAAYEVCLTKIPIVAEPGSGKDWSAK